MRFYLSKAVYNLRVIVLLLATGVCVVVGQASVLQAVLVVLLPEHGLPPPFGVGLLQVLDLYFNPPPQVTVQDV